MDAGGESEGALDVFPGHLIDGQQEGVEVFAGAGVLVIRALAEEVALIDGDVVILFPMGDGGETGLFDGNGIEEAVVEELASALLDVGREEAAVFAEHEIGTEPHDAERKRASLSMACSRIGFSTA
jgi:hypothetical protein